tara:strand:- start:533 stop:1693 length:1161 start_codon:yes stop_codon:yes gene_type:complete
MSLQRSRFEGQQIVNSFNIFLDSEKSSLVGDQQSGGDDVHVHFEGQTIEAADGEIIRLSLLNFTMFNNTYMVNINNSRFNVRGGSGTTASFLDVVNIDRKNYLNLKDLATSFATNLGTYLATKSAATTFENTTILPSSTTMSATDNRLLDITLTAKNASNSTIAHGITDLKIQCLEAEGESNVILGGNRQDVSTDTTFNSFKITGIATGATTIRVQGFFPMQRLSDPYVYLRCNNAQNGLEMSVLSNDRGLYNADIINSDIFAKLFKDVEYINYESNTGDEYFLNLQQRKLANLRLFLTDSKGRKLGRTSGQRDLGTAAGLLDSSLDFESNLQNKTGNLNFTAVIRVDIVKNRNPVKLESEGLPPALPARKTQSTLVWSDYGKPKF